MPRTRRNDSAELLRLALIGLDAQIAELRETRARLAAQIVPRSSGLTMNATMPRKRRNLSAAARATISAAAKARWARERKTKAKAQKPRSAGKKAQVKP